MKRTLVLLALAGAVSPLWASAEFVKEGPVRFASSVGVRDQALVLKGTGTGKFAMMLRVCAAALYGPAAIPVNRLRDENVAKRLEIEYLVALGRGSFVAAAERGLRQQFSEESLRRHEPTIEALHALYRDVRKGDRYALHYDPAGELSLELNGALLGRVPADPEFARMYLDIWLGDRPVSDSLRRHLMGG